MKRFNSPLRERYRKGYSGTKARRTLLGLGMAFLWAVGGVQAQSKSVDALRQEIERLRREYETRLKTLEEKLQSLEKTPKPPAPIPPSVFRFYGFFRADMDYDTSRMGLSGNLPMWVLSEDKKAAGPNQPNLNFHPRLTRLGLEASLPQGVPFLGKAKVNGKLEGDFHNAGSESRAIPRIRHAYVELQWKRLGFLAGQTWDLISPLFPTPNDDTMMWNVGNLGDRRPQFRLTWEIPAKESRWIIASAFSLPGAVDARDLDNDGVRDGEASGKPGLQMRVAYSLPSWVSGQSLQVGLWGHRQWARSTKPIAGHRHFNSYSTGIDYLFPLTSRFQVRGETWFGQDLSDLRGGVGQGVNPSTGREIRSRGGWIELSFRRTPKHSLHFGYLLDDPIDRDLPQEGRTQNSTFYLANRYLLGKGVDLGLDYLYWVTHYKGLKRGIDSRINFFIRYSFP